MTRKGFIKQLKSLLITALIASGFILLRRLLFQILQKTQWLPAKAQDNVKGWLVGRFFFMKKQKKQVRVLSRSCPHLGCTVSINARTDEIVCPCHGSRFSLEGHYISGPAGKDLNPLPTRMTPEGKLEIGIES